MKKKKNVVDLNLDLSPSFFSLSLLASPSLCSHTRIRNSKRNQKRGTAFSLSLYAIVIVLLLLLLYCCSLWERRKEIKKQKNSLSHAHAFSLSLSPLSHLSLSLLFP